MNNTIRFSGKAEIYAKARPDYAAGLFAYMKESLHISEGCVIADIGSGTGIFSRQLLRNGYNVFAVEPNADMRKKAEEMLSEYQGFVSVDGMDSNTNLPDKSMDHVTAAQAFHWFDADAFKKECRRILKPNGKIIIVYNSFDESADSNKALADIRRKYCPDFQGFCNGMNDEKCCAFFNGKCSVFRIDNSKKYDLHGYINRVLSSSHSLKESDERYGEYLEDVNELFNTFSKDGMVTVPMSTVAYAGTV